MCNLNIPNLTIYFLPHFWNFTDVGYKFVRKIHVNGLRSKKMVNWRWMLTILGSFHILQYLCVFTFPTRQLIIIKNHLNILRCVYWNHVFQLVNIICLAVHVFICDYVHISVFTGLPDIYEIGVWWQNIHISLCSKLCKGFNFLLFKKRK